MIKTYLTAEEIQAMIDQAPIMRDKVIISFLSDTGCRVSELLRVKVEHIDFDNEVVLIPHLKRGIRKHCPSCSRIAGRNQSFCSKCGTDLSKIPAEGIEERSRLINVGPETLKLLREHVANSNPSDNIISLSRQHVWNIVRGLGETIGLKGKAILNPETRKKHFVHPHNFRDSLAVVWLNVAGDNAGKQKALQEHLGHKSFGTTMRYHKITPTAVKKVRDEVREARFGGE